MASEMLVGVYRGVDSVLPSFLSGTSPAQSQWELHLTAMDAEAQKPMSGHMPPNRGQGMSKGTVRGMEGVA